MDHSSAAVHGPGLLGGLTGLAKNVFGLVVSRVELAALELSEVRNHVIDPQLVEGSGPFQGKLAFPETMNELKHDREMLL